MPKLIGSIQKLTEIKKNEISLNPTFSEVLAKVEKVRELQKELSKRNDINYKIEQCKVRLEDPKCLVYNSLKVNEENEINALQNELLKLKPKEMIEKKIFKIENKIGESLSNLSPKYTYKQFLSLLQEEESNTCPRCGSIFTNLELKDGLGNIEFSIWEKGITGRKLIKKVSGGKFCEKGIYTVSSDQSNFNINLKS